MARAEQDLPEQKIAKVDRDADVGGAGGRDVDDLETAVDAGHQLAADVAHEAGDDVGVDAGGGVEVGVAPDLGERDDVGVEVGLDRAGDLTEVGDGGEEAIDLSVACDRDLAFDDAAARATDAAPFTWAAREGGHARCSAEYEADARESEALFANSLHDVRFS